MVTQTPYVTPTPACPPFSGGLTIGYWKTHTGLDAPPRDDTYDSLPVFLGVAPSNGDPEQSVDDEMEAFNVFDAATSAGLGVEMLKAQLLAAKLNALKFAGFGDAFLPNGQTVGEAISDADQILDDLANGMSHTKDEITVVKDLLDAANNNSHQPVLRTCEPTPTPCGYSEAGPPCETPTPTPTRTPTPTPTRTPAPCPDDHEDEGWVFRSGGDDDDDEDDCRPCSDDGDEASVFRSGGDDDDEDDCEPCPEDRGEESIFRSGDDDDDDEDCEPCADDKGEESIFRSGEHEDDECRCEDGEHNVFGYGSGDGEDECEPEPCRSLSGFVRSHNGTSCQPTGTHCLPHAGFGPASGRSCKGHWSSRCWGHGPSWARPADCRGPWWLFP